MAATGTEDATTRVVSNADADSAPEASTDDASARVVSDDEFGPGSDDDDDGTLGRGTTMGRYVIRSMAGRGGMGQVYRAFDPDLDREVALKVLERPDGSRTRTAPEWLIREAQAMARLSHPNVVPIYDVETFDGRTFMVMEFVAGQTLAGWLREAPRSVEEILRLFVGAGEGLAAAHEAGVVHRDFKPANVLISEGDVARVMDFGLAHTSDDHQSTGADSVDPAATITVRTQAGVVMGTPAYMAPEQHLGEGVDARSDQFGFCVALFEALEGRRPFTATKLLELAASKTKGPPRVTRPEVPARVRQALQRGLAPDQAQRFPTMRALLDTLQPAPRRRGAVGMGLLGLGAVGLALAWASVEPTVPCEAEDAMLGAVWGEPQRAAINQAMEDSGVSFASDGTERILQGIDAFGERWSSAWQDACRSEGPPAQRDSAMDCLSRQRAELGIMADALAEVDAKNADRAVSVAWSLPDPRACLEPDAPELDAPPPSIAESVQEIREALDRATTLRNLGRQPEALALVQEARPKAEALGYPPLLAEIELELGYIGTRYPEIDAAEELEAAYFRATEAGAIKTATRAAIELVYVYGSKVRDLERAMDWERHALVGLEAGVNQDWRANLDNSMCAALLDASRFDEARVRCQRALERYEQKHGPEHPNLLTSLHNLTKLELIVGRLDVATPLAERAVAIARNSYGPGHPWMRFALGLMGAVAGESGRHQEALGYFRESLEISKATAPHAVEAITRQLENIATTHSRQGDYAAAQAAIEEAIDYAIAKQGPDEPAVGKLRVVLGRILNDGEGEGKSKGKDQARAQRELEAGLELMLPHYGEAHVEVIFARIELGQIAFEQGRLDAAGSLLDRVIQLDPGTVPPDQYAQALIWRAKVELKAHRLEPVGSLLARVRAVESIPAEQRVLVAKVGFEYAKALEGSEDATLEAMAIEQGRLAAKGLDKAKAEDDHDDAATTLRAEIDRWLTDRR